MMCFQAKPRQQEACHLVDLEAWVVEWAEWIKHVILRIFS
jgi:hypothetical protein